MTENEAIYKAAKKLFIPSKISMDLFQEIFNDCEKKVSYSTLKKIVGLVHNNPSYDI
jgi:hypothetical protein